MIYGTEWCASNHPICLSESDLDSGQEVRIVQIDFSAAFNWVDYQGILYELCTVGIGGSVGIDTVSVKTTTARYGGWLSE